MPDAPEPISFQPHPHDRAWLERYAEATGIPAGQIMADALTVFRSQLAVHCLEHAAPDTGPT